jgi:hypothetical protein
MTQAAKTEGPLIVVAAEETPLFGDEAKARSRRIEFVNLRETAGWSVEGTKARPKLAALLEAASEPAPTFPARPLYASKPVGMHLIVRCSDRADDVQLATLAQDAGLAVEPLLRRAVAHPCGRGLLLGFTNVNETDAMDLCRKLEQAIGARLGDKGAHPRRPTAPSGATCRPCTTSSMR